MRIDRVKLIAEMARQSIRHKTLPTRLVYLAAQSLLCAVVRAAPKTL